jgi:hypothetical protein
MVEYKEYILKLKQGQSAVSFGFTRIFMLIINNKKDYSTSLGFGSSAAEPGSERWLAAQAIDHKQAAAFG